MTAAFQTAPDNVEMLSGQDERRARIERRGRERRKPGSRINKVAPRQSLMKHVGAVAVAVTGSAFALTLIGGELLMDGAPLLAVAIIGALTAMSGFVMMFGCIENRLIEIRLELMMANGGVRDADRRAAERRQA